MTATEAKARLLSLLNAVEPGEEIEITRHGRPMARLAPARGPHALKDRFAGIAKAVVPDEDLYSTGATWNVP